MENGKCPISTSSHLEADCVRVLEPHPGRLGSPEGPCLCEGITHRPLSWWPEPEMGATPAWVQQGRGCGLSFTSLRPGLPPTSSPCTRCLRWVHLLKCLRPLCMDHRGTWPAHLLNVCGCTVTSPGKAAMFKLRVRNFNCKQQNHSFPTPLSIPFGLYAMCPSQEWWFRAWVLADEFPNSSLRPAPGVGIPRHRHLTMTPPSRAARLKCTLSCNSTVLLSAIRPTVRI